MRPSEEMPLDPEVLAELEAIDATLAGESVDPAHAELAELALLLVGTRELPPEPFAQSLDARVARRFREAPSTAAPDARRSRRWRSRRVIGVTLAGALAVITAAVVITSGSLTSPKRSPAFNGPAAGALTTFQSLTGTGTASSTEKLSASGSATYGAAGSSAQSTAGTPSLSAAAHTPSSAGAGVNLTTVPAPAGSSGGKEIQSAQLQLTAPNAHIDDVAQEVYNVVSIEGGTVQHSQVTASSHGADGGSYATFTLSVPTANLQATMSRMSSLRYANVSSRTDGTQNVSTEYQADQRHIADQEAIRTALLKQLQTADTDSAIDSIQAQLKLTESQLASDQAALRSLQHQISYSTLSVQVNAGPIGVLGVAPSHGFTIGRAAHDSVRVLVVATGVALIACAVLVPFGLLMALGFWFAFALRRRRRQDALDAA